MDNQLLKQYLATGEATSAMDEAPMTDLQKHDAKYHPNGYKEGDSCMYRETMAKKDKADDLGGGHSPITRETKSGKTVAAIEKWEKELEAERQKHRPDLPEQVKKWDRDYRRKQAEKYLKTVGEKKEDGATEAEKGNEKNEHPAPNNPSNTPKPNPETPQSKAKKEWYKEFADRKKAHDFDLPDLSKIDFTTPEENISLDPGKVKLPDPPKKAPPRGGLKMPWDDALSPEDRDRQYNEWLKEQKRKKDNPMSDEEIRRTLKEMRERPQGVGYSGLKGM